MKKIPTLFERVYENHKIVGIIDKVHPGMEWVLEGEGTATVKWDGSACAIINGEFYKRYDAKNGKSIPEGAIKCQDEQDPVTGHMPCWIKCDRKNPADKWFWKAYDNYMDNISTDGVIVHNLVADAKDGTYEAIGEHFQGNPYECCDTLVPHGMDEIPVERTFDGIKEFFRKNLIEGIVFWKDGEPKCKIKRTDFGFEKKYWRKHCVFLRWLIEEKTPR